MPMMADVLYRAMYGGVTGSAGTTDVRSSAGEDQGGVTQGEADVPVSETNRGAGSGLTIIAVVAVLGLAGYGIAATGSVKGGMHKAGRNLHEMTGGLIGKKPDPDEKSGE